MSNPILKNASGKFGRKNLLINGCFRVWQRGESFPNSEVYVADRWRATWSGASGETQKGSYFAFGPSQTYPYLLIQPDVADDLIGISQTVEQPQSLSGRTMTLSGLVYLDSSASIRLYIQQYINAQSGSSVQLGSDLSIEGGAWVPFSWTFVCPDISGLTPADNDYFDFSIRRVESSLDNIRFAQIQLEFGDIATEFEHRPIVEELALCRRYYQEIDLSGNAIYLVGRSEGASAGPGYGMLTLPTEMRAAPAFSETGSWSSDSTYFGAPNLRAAKPGAITINSSATVGSGNSGWLTGGIIHLDAEF